MGSKRVALGRSVRRGQRYALGHRHTRQRSGQLVIREMLSGFQHEHETLAVAPTRRHSAVIHAPRQASKAAAGEFRAKSAPPCAATLEVSEEQGCRRRSASRRLWSRHLQSRPRAVRCRETTRMNHSPALLGSFPREGSKSCEHVVRFSSRVRWRFVTWSHGTRENALSARCSRR